MEYLFYVCTTQEIAQDIINIINTNMTKKNGGNWDTPTLRVDGKWCVSYTNDPLQAWRFENVIGYESIEPYQEGWWGNEE